MDCLQTHEREFFEKQLLIAQRAGYTHAVIDLMQAAADAAKEGNKSRSSIISCSAHILMDILEKSRGNQPSLAGREDQEGNRGGEIPIERVIKG